FILTGKLRRTAGTPAIRFTFAPLPGSNERHCVCTHGADFCLPYSPCSTRAHSFLKEDNLEKTNIRLDTEQHDTPRAAAECRQGQRDPGGRTGPGAVLAGGLLERTNGWHRQDG